MTEKTTRLHLDLSGATRRELGVARGTALRATLADAYANYEGLFRTLGVTADQQEAGVERVLETLATWRPAVVEELSGIAEGAGLKLSQIVSLNARTEIIAMSPRASSECSTVTAVIDGHRFGVQTWDWHIEFDSFWHTHEVTGPGYRYVGLTEQGIVSKIGVNEAGLGLHFNILGHREDHAQGVPMHVLSSVVLTECATIAEAIELIRAAPITSSSAFTMVDATGAVSVEISPAGIFPIPEVAGSVQRTNHFQHETPLASQKSEVYEPDSSERLALVRERLGGGLPSATAEMIELLVSGEGQPPLTCVADMSKEFGERWATLATIVTDPDAHTIRILDGMPTDAATGAWRTLTA
ncbi:C45 family autoproteolytic acyltransferase/hydolase [Leucobacter luti]|uniref:Isopenicillin-N N-acyltransferase-like protein n=1 Tax=Leucobacter luti TaxID=340320 RepID=A0A4Q7TZF9_9MICO|nr:C45 family peptidase [Leucobacter luti]MBL3699049.1 hypothetical protein [Leucobacter luti]RZT66551.1 isopenicillin-N N-acyltransferase-like protein [Leucobacter luti]